jgi:hypothetical protein
MANDRRTGRQTEKGVVADATRRMLAQQRATHAAAASATRAQQKPLRRGQVK